MTLDNFLNELEWLMIFRPGLTLLAVIFFILVIALVCAALEYYLLRSQVNLARTALIAVGLIAIATVSLHWHRAEFFSRNDVVIEGVDKNGKIQYEVRLKEE